MFKKIRPWISRNSIGALICLILAGALAGALFGSGHWLGERTQPQKLSPPLAAVGNPPQEYLTGSRVAPAFIPPPSIVIPPNASLEMKEFWQNRIMLSNKLAELRAQNPNDAQDPKLMAQFQHDNADLLQRQKQLARIISQQPVPDLPPLQLPPNASPALKAFLTTRDQLQRDEIRVINEHRMDDSKVRQAALQQWRQQNAARFDQLRQEEDLAMSDKPEKDGGSAR
jgi:hypothetical protein